MRFLFILKCIYDAALSISNVTKIFISDDNFKSLESIYVVLFLVEKSLGKKIVCLVVCPQGQKNIFYWKHKTLVSCVECWSRDGRWHGGCEIPPPPTGVKGTHIRGQKNIFLKKSIFCFGCQK